MTNETTTDTLPSKKSGWIIDEKQKTREDFTEYLTNRLMVCLEMELNYKTGIHDSTIESVSKDEFGVDATEYGLPECPVCGENDCIRHDPPKTIRVIRHDSTVRGKEIIVWGSPISTEEFAKRLPLENIKKYFVPRPQDSLHTHTLIPNQNKAIPIQIAQNTWQLFRAYYPAWVHIFGNYRKHFLRSNWAQWKNYQVNALDTAWWPYACHKFQGGLHFANCNKDYDGNLSSFDAEIRTQDASTNLEQIVSARALSKAIFLKAAQLSNEGVIEMPEERKEIILPIIEALNSGCAKIWREGKRTYDMELESKHGRFMKELAAEFFSQVRPLLSEFEARCVGNCIANPIRLRRTKFA
jgi:hypothetical protein